MIGQKFGLLTIIKILKPKVDKIGRKRHHCKVKCRCGKTTKIRTENLISKNTRSCGCNRKYFKKDNKLALKHGFSYSKEYNVWRSLIYRCERVKNKNSFAYKYYKARGIKMYNGWKGNFLAFFNYIGPMPTPQHTIDRIDSNGNYEPGNVRWATMKEQAQNRKIPKKYKKHRRN